jgi:hypothetical protein
MRIVGVGLYDVLGSSNSPADLALVLKKKIVARALKNEGTTRSLFTELRNTLHESHRWTVTGVLSCRNCFSLIYLFL